MQRRIYLLTIVCIALFLLSFAHIRNLFIDSAFDYRVKAESTHGKTWTSFSDGRWDVLHSIKEMSEDFALKNEDESQSRIEYVGLAEITLDPQVKALVSEGESGELYLQQGRLWGSYFATGGVPLRIVSDISELIIDTPGSFWMEIDSEYFRFASISGELHLKVQEFEDVVYESKVPNGLLYELERGNARSFRNLSQSDLEGHRFGGGSGGGGSLRSPRPSSNAISEKQALKKILPTNGNAEVLEFVEVVEEPAALEEELPRIGFDGDDLNREELEIVADQVAGEKKDDEVVEPIGFVDGHFRPKIRSGVMVDKEFEGQQPLTAKWYYEPELSGGPVFIDVKQITEPGSYVFDFPLHAKPPFMSGDVWPAGTYFVKIYFDRELIDEYSVERE